MNPEIMELVEVIRQANHQLKEMEEEMKPIIAGAKARLVSLLQQHGNYTDAEGYARITSPSLRVTYDYKALDELIANDPAGQYQWLRDYRKETPVKGGVTVK